MNLALYEPPPTGDAGFDVMLSAPNGTLVIVQAKSTPGSPSVDIRAVMMGRDARAPTSTDISLSDSTPEAIVEQVRRIFAA